MTSGWQTFFETAVGRKIDLYKAKWVARPNTPTHSSNPSKRAG